MTLLYSLSAILRKKLAASALILAFVSTASVSSRAVVIDFDDLVPAYDPEIPCFCDNPLTDQYASKGLLIDNAYLNGESIDGGLTYENIMLTGPYTSLQFIGALPTFVSMYVTSANDDAIYLTAFGPDGYIEGRKTSGWAGPDDDTPALPNQFVSFTSPTGISSINIDSFYFLRVGASIDNLTYTYASVPEPSPLVLFAFGIAALTYKRYSKRILR